MHCHRSVCEAVCCAFAVLCDGGCQMGVWGWFGRRIRGAEGEGSEEMSDHGVKDAEEQEWMVVQ